MCTLKHEHTCIQASTSPSPSTGLTNNSTNTTPHQPNPQWALAASNPPLEAPRRRRIHLAVGNATARGRQKAKPYKTVCRTHNQKGERAYRPKRRPPTLTDAIACQLKSSYTPEAVEPKLGRPRKKPLPEASLPAEKAVHECFGHRISDAVHQESGDSGDGIEPTIQPVANQPAPSTKNRNVPPFLSRSETFWYEMRKPRPEVIMSSRAWTRRAGSRDGSG
jgi:hypothetical protein